MLEMQPPQGLGDKLRALGKLKSLADSRAQDRLERALPGGRARAARSRPAADPDLLARRRRARSSRCRRSSRRIRARAGATSACTACRSTTRPRPGLHWQIHKDAAADWRDGAGRMEVAISIGSDPITAYAGSCPAPKHVDELMVAGFLRGKPVEVVQCKTVDLQVPARAEIVLEGYCERGELGRRGAVRRPHRLLHARRAVPRAAPDVHDDAPRRDLPEHPRRAAAGRGRLARQGHRAPLPAGAARHAARARRLRPAGRRRLPQLLHRLDPQGLSRATRARSCTRSGAPACSSLTKMVVVVDEWVDVHDYGQVAWQVGANVDPGPRRRAGARPARPARPRAVAAVARRQARARRDRDVAGRGLPARVARGRAHERRGAPPRRRALGLARDRSRAGPAGASRRRPGSGADGAARSGPGREPLPRPARDPAVRGRGLARARARPPPGCDRRHARRRARLGRPARRALAHARDHGLHLRARPQLERGRRRSRRGDRGGAAGRRRRPRHPRRAARHAGRRARRRSRARDGRALRARDRRRRALGRAAARARRPPAGDPVSRPGCAARRSPSRRPTPCARSSGSRAPTTPIPPATTSRARTARPTASCSRSSRPRTAGGRGSSTPASRAMSSRASRSAWPRAASPRSRRSRPRCRRPSRSPRGDSLLRLADLPDHAARLGDPRGCGRAAGGAASERAALERGAAL